MKKSKSKKGISFYQKTKKYFLDNKWIFLLLVLVITFFIWQRATNMGWDILVYILNVKYWFDKGSFFESVASPLSSFLIGIFSFAGWKTSEYIYIIFVAILHLFSSIKFAEKFKINKLLFYALSLSPFLLYNGLLNGTELLSLSLLQLFIAYLGSKKSPFFLGLSFLARSSNLIFCPLLIFTKNWKKLLRDILILIITIAPWFIFDYLTTGSPFTSFMNSYALNVKFRSYIHQPVNFIHVLTVLSYLLPLGLAGIILKGKETKLKSKNFWIMIFLIILTFIGYARTPIKDGRYLFTLLLPFTYFSVIALGKLKKKILVFIMILLILLSLGSGVMFNLDSMKNPRTQAKTYVDAINETRDKIDGCRVCSNAYLQLNYLGVVSERAPDRRLLSYRLGEGCKVLLFKQYAEPDYVNDKDFLSNFPVLKETNNYILLGNSSCAPIRKVNQTYLESVDELYRVAYNSSYKITFYELFFTDKSA